MFGLIANVVSDHVLRHGAKVRIIANRGAKNVEVTGLSKGGRRVTKYIAYKRLTNFRPAFVPENHRCFQRAYWATKEEAQVAANMLNVMWQGVRAFHPDGRLLQDGVTVGEAFKRFESDPNYQYRHVSPFSFMGPNQ